VRNLKHLAGGTKLSEVAQLYATAPFWIGVAVMLLGQAALLAVPVNLANRRPVTRRSLLLPVLAAGFMMAALLAGAIYSLCEFRFGEKEPDWVWWSGPVAGLVLWCIWSVVFFRMSRNIEPGNFISKQCRLLFKGSILELLIAVPTHIVVRSRDYCCAGFMTFIGITFGLSVMFFSLGPAVFFLYVDRWRRLHPAPRAEPQALVNWRLDGHGRPAHKPHKM